MLLLARQQSSSTFSHPRERERARWQAENTQGSGAGSLFSPPCVSQLCHFACFLFAHVEIPTHFPLSAIPNKTKKKKTGPRKTRERVSFRLLDFLSEEIAAASPTPFSSHSKKQNQWLAELRRRGTRPERPPPPRRRPRTPVRVFFFFFFFFLPVGLCFFFFFFFFFPFRLSFLWFHRDDGDPGCSSSSSPPRDLLLLLVRLARPETSSSRTSEQHALRHSHASPFSSSDYKKKHTRKNNNNNNNRRPHPPRPQDRQDGLRRRRRQPRPSRRRPRPGQLGGPGHRPARLVHAHAGREHRRHPLHGAVAPEGGQGDGSPGQAGGQARQDKGRGRRLGAARGRRCARRRRGRPPPLAQGGSLDLPRRLLHLQASGQEPDVARGAAQGDQDVRGEQKEELEFVFFIHSFFSPRLQTIFIFFFVCRFFFSPLPLSSRTQAHFNPSSFSLSPPNYKKQHHHHQQQQ